MAWIGGSAGIFSLKDSDRWCGSCVSISDAAKLFDISPSDVVASGVKVIELKKAKYVAEIDLHKAWGSGKIRSKHQPRIGRAKRSLDELILQKLIQIGLSDAEVVPQATRSSIQVDLLVKHKGTEAVVEFFGPSHFIPQYQPSLEPPSVRKAKVESAFGCECVIWPFWIQRCVMNVRGIYAPMTQGIASVWSTKALFGDFYFDDSAHIILSLTNRFNALRNNSLGYMYMNDVVKNKPVHPAIGKIAKGKMSKAKLIPKGRPSDERIWLPESLISSSDK
jgi:hypothetical protein